MFTSSTCYNATLRVADNLGESNAVMRIGRVLERFEADAEVQALGTCGVITYISILLDDVAKTVLTEVRLDDGIDNVALVLPFSKFHEFNLGDILKVTVKNKILSRELDATLYSTLRAEKLGVVTENDLVTAH